MNETNKCKCGKKVEMSVPEDKEFNKPYTMDTTLHSDHYWDTNRNKDQFAKDMESFPEQLDRTVKKITTLLEQKNKAYGNTALNPTNIFSKLSASEAICARIDDKLARIGNKGIYDETEDTVDDLIGYLLLLKMSL